MVIGVERMDDAECLKIEMSAWRHLLRCIFEDWSITTYETSNALQHLRKEIKE